MSARFLIIAILVVMAGCTAPQALDAPDYDIRRGIFIATDATFAPFHYIDDRGEVTGFDVELAARNDRCWPKPAAGLLIC